MPVLQLPANRLPTDAQLPVLPGEDINLVRFILLQCISLTTIRGSVAQCFTMLDLRSTGRSFDIRSQRPQANRPHIPTYDKKKQYNLLLAKEQ